MPLHWIHHSKAHVSSSIQEVTCPQRTADGAQKCASPKHSPVVARAVRSAMHICFTPPRGLDNPSICTMQASGLDSSRLRGPSLALTGNDRDTTCSHQAIHARPRRVQLHEGRLLLSGSGERLATQFTRRSNSVRKARSIQFVVPRLARRSCVGATSELSQAVRAPLAVFTSRLGREYISAARCLRHAGIDAFRVNADEASASSILAEGDESVRCGRCRRHRPASGFAAEAVRGRGRAQLV